MDVIVVNLLHDPVVQGVRDQLSRHHRQASGPEALRESEERFRALVAEPQRRDRGRVRGGLFTFVGESVGGVLGYDPDELVGTTFGSSCTRTTSNGRRDRREALPRIPASHGVRDASSARDGSWRWIEATGTNHLETPSVRGVVFNFRDVTERRASQEQLEASEERFRTLVQHASDVVQIMDAEAASRG